MDIELSRLYLEFINTTLMNVCPLLHYTRFDGISETYFWKLIISRHNVFWTYKFRQKETGVAKQDVLIVRYYSDHRSSTHGVVSTGQTKSLDSQIFDSTCQSNTLCAFRLQVSKSI